MTDHFLVVVGAVSTVDQTARLPRILLLTQQPLLLGTGGRRGGREGGEGGRGGREGERGGGYSYRFP